jgi:hypothetical protein
MEVVSFEIAKKLKEKGFPQKYMGGYDMIGPTYIDDGRFYENGCITEVARAYSAPSISQTLKWLREEKKIHIQVLFACPPNRWEYVTIRITNCEIRGMQASFVSYEQAAIAGIEYCLDNLI